jgi:hypothetical protein
MLDWFLYIFLGFFFIALIYLEVKKYRRRSNHLDLEYQKSLDMMSEYDKRDDSVMADIYKERFFRLKKDQLQKQIDDEFRNQQKGT